MDFNSIINMVCRSLRTWMTSSMAVTVPWISLPEVVMMVCSNSHEAEET
jgi:hypothetical protein